MSYYSYNVSVSFKNTEDFLKCFNELCLSGFKCYCDIVKYENSIKFNTIQNNTILNEILKVIKKNEVLDLYYIETTKDYKTINLFENGVKK